MSRSRTLSVLLKCPAFGFAMICLLKLRGTATARSFRHASNATLTSAACQVDHKMSDLKVRFFCAQLATQNLAGSWAFQAFFLGEAVDVVVKLAIVSLLSPNSPSLRRFGVSHVLNLGSNPVLKPKTQQSLNLRG
jgi:hypothetical protein